MPHLYARAAPVAPDGPESVSVAGPFSKDQGREAVPSDTLERVSWQLQPFGILRRCLRRPFWVCSAADSMMRAT